MKWIPCSERLPEHSGPATFYGGRASALVIGRWEHDAGIEVRQCLHIAYDGDVDPADGWMDVDDSGSCDRCTSHGGQPPSHWIPMPEIE